MSDTKHTPGAPDEIEAAFLRGKRFGYSEGYLAGRDSTGCKEELVSLEQVEELAKTMWKGEPLPGRVLRFGAAVLGLVDAARAAEGGK